MSYPYLFFQNLIIITRSWEMLFCNWRLGVKNPVPEMIATNSDGFRTLMVLIKHI